MRSCRTRGRRSPPPGPGRAAGGTPLMIPGSRRVIISFGRTPRSPSPRAARTGKRTYSGGISPLGKNMVPTRLFFTKGVGKHKERLTSFELALRDAGIAAQNLVRVSSIFPPNCKLIPRKEGLKFLNPGEVVFAVVAENSTREPHRLVVSSIGVAIPTDKNTYGYLSEHHSFGETEDQAGDYAEELAAEMLATTLDVDFDPDKSWDEKKEIYRMSDKIVRTANVTQSAVGHKNGLWTTTIAAAILLFDDPS
ncbi:MAG TPA: arginine decarboxylase, pyruvoyl-dependent [Acidobacteriaceae bacterium]|nr:arginine decarboxylase, pyruvoyl-dependent [Acidobacteriaceae bacterium]